MAIELVEQKYLDFLVQDYEGEWNYFPLPRGKSVETRPFSPIPNNNVQFCFDIFYDRYSSTYSSSRIESDELRVKIIHVFGSVRYLKMKVHVTVYYRNSPSIYGHFYLDISSCGGINSSELLYPRNVTRTVSEGGHLTDHGRLMEDMRDSVRLTCHVTIFGHLGKISEYDRQMMKIQNLSNFNNDMKVLYETKTGSDVTLEIGEKIILAHKCVLIAHSPVFLKMLDQEFLKSGSNSIIITSANIGKFECFLKYLYSGELEDNSLGWLTDIYLLAEEYDVQSLKRDCSEMIGSKLSKPDIYFILEFAYDHCICNLKEKAIKYAAENYSRIRTFGYLNGLAESRPQISRDVLAKLQEFKRRGLLASY